jgi:hypothetical protein
MTTNKNNKKKSSAARKLIPAIGMLTVSAMMLSSSTYAWFTMSREVEVTGINMSAVVPEDLQIAIGDEATGVKKLLSANPTLDGTAADEVPYAEGAQVFGNTVKAPTTDANSNDWHNSVAFSDYYHSAMLYPASSTDGNYLFKTADANSQGESVSNTATFTALTLASAKDVAANDGARNDMAALYVNGEGANIAKRSDAGYYVDFPVWFRTSASTAEVTGLTKVASGANTHLELGVKATITQNTGTEAKEDLYHAVRIAVLPTTGEWNATGTVANTAGTITGVIHDGVEKGEGDSAKKYWDRYSSTNCDPAVSFDRQAVKSAGTLAFNPSTNMLTNVGNIYGTADIVKQATADADSDGLFDDGEVVVSVPLSSSANEYGTPVKYIIRVWLEGEDQYCWNPNAGQDWNVSLRFVKLDTTENAHNAPANAAAGQGTASVTGTVASAAATIPTTIAVTAGNSSLGNITIANGKATCASGITNVLDATTVDPGRKTYTLADGTRIGNSADLAKYVEDHLGKYDFSAGIALTEVTTSNAGGNSGGSGNGGEG